MLHNSILSFKLFNISSNFWTTPFTDVCQHWNAFKLRHAKPSFPTDVKTSEKVKRQPFSASFPCRPPQRKALMWSVSYYIPNFNLKQLFCRWFKSLDKMEVFLKASSLNLSKMYNYSSQHRVFSLAVENATAVLHPYSPLEEMETGPIPFCSRLVMCLQ